MSRKRSWCGRTALLALVTAWCGGCSESHVVLDMDAPDLGPECGFLADGECPAGCLGFAGARADELPTACVEVDPEHYVWCGDPNALLSPSFWCFIFPSGEVVMLHSIPGDFPDAETCSVNPLLLCDG